MLNRKGWSEFRDAGLLWWVNRSLHIFGWAIFFDMDDAGNVLDVYPAQTDFRGFPEATEADGFVRLTQHVANNAEKLLEDVKS